MAEFMLDMVDINPVFRRIRDQNLSSADSTNVRIGDEVFVLDELFVSNINSAKIYHEKGHLHSLCSHVFLLQCT